VQAEGALLREEHHEHVHQFTKKKRPSSKVLGNSPGVKESIIEKGEGNSTAQREAVLVEISQIKR